MGKRAKNFKEDTLKLISQLPTELALAALLGAIPIWWYSKSAQTLDEMASGLLAIGPLIDYYAWMMLPYLVVLGIKLCFRFRSDRGTNTFNFIHKVIAEAGTGFQTILRTGSGVAIGILALPKDIVSPTTAQYWMLYGMTTSILIVNCAISMSKSEVMKRIDRPTYKNSLKLNIK